MTKTESHSYMKYNSHLNKDSYQLSKQKEKLNPKPTLISCNNNLQVFRKAIREWYKQRENNQ